MNRKVKYIIDDIRWFQSYYGLTTEQTEEIFSNQESFKVIFTLIGEDNKIDKYELTDHEGNKVLRSSLNGHQRGVVLNDCYAHFEERKYTFDTGKPIGVIKIEEYNGENEVIDNGVRITQTN